MCGDKTKRVRMVNCVMSMFLSEFSLENEVFKSNFHAGKMTTHRGNMSHTFVAAITGPL